MFRRKAVCSGGPSHDARLRLQRSLHPAPLIPPSLLPCLSSLPACLPPYLHPFCLPAAHPPTLPTPPKQMGVCPQFDILWNELTGAEHLSIYGHVKGLPWRKVAEEEEALLDKVGEGAGRGRQGGRGAVCRYQPKLRGAGAREDGEGERVEEAALLDKVGVRRRGRRGGGGGRLQGAGWGRGRGAGWGRGRGRGGRVQGRGRRAAHMHTGGVITARPTQVQPHTNTPTSRYGMPSTTSLPNHECNHSTTMYPRRSS